MPGPARKLPHLRMIEGTASLVPKKKTGETKTVPVVKVPESPPIEEPPPPPKWLPNTYATTEWKRLTRILVANKLLTESGLSALGHLCSLHGKLAQLWAAGETPTGHIIAQYRSLINDFALTPVSQGRVKTNGQEDPKNPFTRNGQRPSSSSSS